MIHETSLLADRQTFSDIQQMVANGPFLRMDYKQLECGAFVGDRIGVSLPSGRFWRSRANVGGYGVGEMAPGLLMVGLMGANAFSNAWHGRPLGQNSLLLGSHQTGLDHRPGLQMEVFLWTFPIARYRKMAESLGVDLPGDLERLPPVLELDDTSALQLRNLVTNGIRTCEYRPLRSGELRQFEEQLMAQTIHCVDSKLLPKATCPDREIFLRARDWLHDHPNSRVTLPEICRDLKVEERTLRNHFARAVGCGPIDYHLAYRLNQVRLRLVAAKPERGAVTRIANELGFHHMGRFGQQFRDLFGEGPGQTLRR